MPLHEGTRLGPYVIVGPLGAGGMGEVYRARDSKLQRDVALKVLPEDVAAEAERLARFEREARTLASLNHPHIAQVHGLEHGPLTDPGNGTGSRASASCHALIMELVEGDDLTASIARGPLPLDEALVIARQIADAMDAAHTAGVVHRDLKPANVKVRHDGTVKVLDFGLAKSAVDALSQPQAATVTSPAMMTRAGVILGTAAYMAPEQARGKCVDKRADIWSFGCVLFEMLTGRPAFDGETLTDVLAAVLRREPDWSQLPADTPPRVAHLLRRCLQKEPGRRLRDIGDARLELEEAASPESLVRADPASVPSRAPRRPVAWIATLIVASGAAAALGYFARPHPDQPLLKFNVAVQQQGGVVRWPVISPDGQRIAYVGRSRLWVHALDEWTPRELVGTEGAVRPFWSPDSQWIGYFRSERLLKVAAAGGPVLAIAHLPAVQAPVGVNSGAWAEDGMITVSLASGPLLRVPGGGGRAVPFVDVPSDVALDLHDVSSMPDGALLATLHRQGRAAPDAIGVIKDGSLRVVLEVEGVSHPRYAAPGYLVFTAAGSQAALWGVSFALGSHQVTGERFLITNGADPSVARDGTLSFVSAERTARQLAWFNTSGRVEAPLAEPREWLEGVAISQDGRRVLAAAADGIWVYDAETGVRSRVTTGHSDITPDWVDANTLVFVRSEIAEPPGNQPVRARGEPMLMMRGLSPGSEERVLARGARFPRVTADGRRIVFNVRVDDGAGWQVAWIDRDRLSEVRRLGAGHQGARFPTPSPDGSLVAYVSGEVGKDEIFMTRLPDGETKWQISTAGGGWALFSPGGDAVWYRAPDGAMMSVPITGGSQIRIGPPRKLFDWGATWLPFYDLAADGTRGLAAVPAGDTPPVASVAVMKHWQKDTVRR